MDCVFVEIEARQGFLFGPLRIKIFGTGAFATLGFEEAGSELSLYVRACHSSFPNFANFFLAQYLNFASSIKLHFREERESTRRGRRNSELAKFLPFHADYSA